MRYFKFVGDPGAYCFTEELIKGEAYREDQYNFVVPTGNKSSKVIEMYYEHPLDWEEVSEEYYLIMNQKEVKKSSS